MVLAGAGVENEGNGDMGTVCGGSFDFASVEFEVRWTDWGYSFVEASRQCFSRFEL